LIYLRYPSPIIFGRGGIEKLAEEVASFGKSALIVTGKSSMRKSGALERIFDILSSKCVTFYLFDGVEHDPSLATVNRGIKLAREKKPSVVIGIGGGSAIDAAKAIAIVAPKEGWVEDYYRGKKEITAPGLPFIAVPTTSGTGAEITSNAVLTDTEKKIKKSLRSPFMVAKVAIVDPDLTLSCPPFLTACAGMDALTQAVECFISRVSNPVSDTLALEATGILYQNLPLAVKNGDDPTIREKMALGSLLQAMAFSNSALGAAHGLAHALGVCYNIPHGLACGVLLPHVLEYNLSFCREKAKKIAERLKIEKEDNLPQMLKGLLIKIGLPLNFKTWKVKEEDIPLLIEKSKGRSMSSNPRSLSDEELSQILRKVI